MKKNIALFMIACLLIMSAMCVSAANDEISVYLQGFSGIDGEKIQFDISPQTINGRTMVPIRAIFEAMGASVTCYNIRQNTCAGTICCRGFRI